jgi:hypothetical protein
MEIWKKDILERNPSEVPTGQMVLQYKRPFVQDNRIIKQKKSVANPKAKGTKPTCSTS